ncbi:cysteine synthase family protein [Hyphobacterium sp. CCMP332]|uniref:PLP-dependent cysteine synthase family protein n=1 Tax=Hyphobacterium sp. CCMP332 TaxID=2749086 RepID=UPI00164EEEDF|nr:cysteine synthase family protein [Hyphobacterium sp. CCMP332]QNL19933.1 cysteine synthase family protein [Hyphobacterium sp. CCMP332]
MTHFPDIISAIGNTPLVKLNKVVPEGSATILAKCEFLNPTGSIKDRMGPYIIEQAEKAGLLKPGGTIVENTSGNTGQSLAMAAAVKGYKCVFTLPDKMSQEKIDMMRAYGATVVITPTDVPGDSPEHYVNTAKRIAEETEGAFYVDQYHAPWNIDGHYHNTGREIFEQTDGGKFDVFMGGTGTGGTVSGVGRYMKEYAPDVKIIGVDPLGSVHYNLFKTGRLPAAYVYSVEGIGEDIECRAMDFSVVDDMVQIDDWESFHMGRALVREEGLFCGGSSGSIVAAAVKVAREMGPGKTIVVTLCDSGTRYISKYLSDKWMEDKGFFTGHELLGPVQDLVARRSSLTASSEASGDDIQRMMTEGDLDYLPLQEGDSFTAIATRDGQRLSIGGILYAEARIEEMPHILAKGDAALVMTRDGVVGVVTEKEYNARIGG